MTDLQQKLAVVISHQNIAWRDCVQIADAILAKFGVTEKKPRYFVDCPRGHHRWIVVDWRNIDDVVDFGIRGEERATEYVNWLNAKDESKPQT